jgi:hypothetical protein
MQLWILWKLHFWWINISLRVVWKSVGGKLIKGGVTQMEDMGWQILKWRGAAEWVEQKNNKQKVALSKKSFDLDKCEVQLG